MLTQLLLNAVLSAGRFVPLVVAFWLVRNVAGFFDLSLGALLVLAAYVALLIQATAECGLTLAIAIASMVVGLVAVALNALIYTPLKKRGASSVVLLLASLGVAVVLENLLGMCCGRHTQSLTGGSIGHVVRLGDTSITTPQIAMLIASVTLTTAFIVAVWMRDTGLRMRALASDATLGVIVGIPRARVVLITYFVAGCLVAASGCFLALEFDVRPTGGLHSLLTAAVGAIVGGRRYVAGPIVGIVVVTCAQQGSAVLFGAAWQDASTLALLMLVFLVRSAYPLERRPDTIFAE